MSEEHNRAEFEAKCRKLGYRVVREENGYLAVDTDQLWVFWKAAIDQAMKKASQDLKLNDTNEE